MLSPGTRLGPHEIVALIGAGGMGEVYRARDPRLGRDVAIKVLPAAYSADPDRLQRFEQEARAVAALNHPNILAIHDIGQHDGAPYIITELLDGATLRERLTEAGRVLSDPAKATSGGLPVRKAVDYAVQMAHGLTAAYEKGMTHRDLKPDNVFVTADGRVKILDFGLAKLTQPETALSNASTTAFAAREFAAGRGPVSIPGMVMGTIGYMSPEQVRGATVDHRADVFAFGVILYELLSGRRAFRGDTAMDVMSAILKEDPPELPATERQIPPGLVRIVNRCMEKSPAARFQTASDLAFALEGLSSQSEVGLPAAAVSAQAALHDRAGTARVAWVTAGVFLLTTLGLGALYLGRAPAAARTIRFEVEPPEAWSLELATRSNASVGPIAVSPDGLRIALVVQRADRDSAIWVRSLDSLVAQELGGTDGAGSIFWSPDSQSLGFFADGKLKKIDVSGGPPVTLCDANPGLSGTWNREGTIVFSPAPATALQKVSAPGGVPTAATERAPGETGHARPFFLPDGEHFLYVGLGATAAADELERATDRGPSSPPAGARGAAPESRVGAVFAGSLTSAKRTLILDRVDSTNVLYSRGHLLFLRETTLMAQPFDPDRLVLAGEAFPVAEEIQTLGNPAYGFFSASEAGVLAYQAGAATGDPQLVWIDRAGKPVATVGDQAAFSDLSLAPDGRRAAVRVAPGDLWVFDLARGLRTRFTVDASDERASIWSPDGSRVIFNANRMGRFDLYQKSSSGTGVEELLLADAHDKYPTSWAPDGQSILFTSIVVGGSGQDIWVLPLSERKPVSLLQTPFNEATAQFSPDGRWIAHVSNETGRSEVYVVPAPAGSRETAGPAATGGKWLVSTGGGAQPRWSRDGREIFYLAPAPDQQLMAAKVNVRGSAFEVGAVSSLFRVVVGGVRAFYDVSPDGQRFLFNTALAETRAPSPITVVVNWQAAQAARASR